MLGQRNIEIVIDAVGQPGRAPAGCQPVGDLDVVGTRGGKAVRQIIVEPIGAAGPAHIGVGYAAAAVDDIALTIVNRDLAAPYHRVGDAEPVVDVEYGVYRAAGGRTHCFRDGEFVEIAFAIAGALDGQMWHAARPEVSIGTSTPGGRINVLRRVNGAVARRFVKNGRAEVPLELGQRLCANGVNRSESRLQAGCHIGKRLGVADYRVGIGRRPVDLDCPGVAIGSRPAERHQRGAKRGTAAEGGSPFLDLDGDT